MRTVNLYKDVKWTISWCSWSYKSKNGSQFLVPSQHKEQADSKEEVLLLAKKLGFTHAFDEDTSKLPTLIDLILESFHSHVS